MAYGDKEGFVNFFSKPMTWKIPKLLKPMTATLSIWRYPQQQTLANLFGLKKSKLSGNIYNDSCSITEHKTLKGTSSGSGTVSFFMRWGLPNHLQQRSNDQAVAREERELVQTLKGHEKGRSHEYCWWFIKKDSFTIIIIIFAVKNEKSQTLPSQHQSQSHSRSPTSHFPFLHNYPPTDIS